jgi:hypothetical protein
MPSPNSAQSLIDSHLRQLHDGTIRSVEPEDRDEICAGLMSAPIAERTGIASRANDLSPQGEGDRLLRAHLELLSAKKVATFWEQACLETDANFSEREDPAEIRRQIDSYVRQRQSLPLEHISVYDVPRAFIPVHIIEATELALAGKVVDQVAFRNEANEWWQIYSRPEQMERECFIKWAAQDALYVAIGMRAIVQAQNAVFAYAGIFSGDDFDSRTCVLDEHKEREFWNWWLSEAIPQAVADLSKPSR